MTMKRCEATVVIGISCVAVLCAAAAAENDRSGIASLHARVITPASDALFQAESTSPATPDAWEKVAARAAELARGAEALESLESVKGQEQWLQFARTLAAKARQAARSARAKNQDALVSANGEIVSVCEDCHAKYRDAGRSMKE